MTSRKKIEQYGLEKRVLELLEEGKTDTEIAEILTEETPDDVSLSQPTVSRWLGPIKKIRQAIGTSMIYNRINTKLLSDTDKVEKAIDRLAEDALDTKITTDPKARAEICTKLLKGIFEKWEVLGIKPFEDKPIKHEVTGKDGEPIQSEGELALQAGPGISGIVDRLISSGIAGPDGESKTED